MSEIYSVPMNLTYRVDVSVEADSEEEARDTVMRTAWFDNGLSRGELTNWEVVGKIKRE